MRQLNGTFHKKQKRAKKLKQPNWMNESIVEAIKQRDFELN